MGPSRASRRAVCLAAVVIGFAAQDGQVSASDSVAASQPFRPSPAQLAFLDQTQHDTFRFFWEASPASGLTPDRASVCEVSNVAAVGFALTSYVVGVERGYVTRADAAARTLTTLKTLWKAPQGPAAKGASGYHGLFYHFIDARHGLRTDDDSELSTIDTALLMAGVLSAEVYFDRDDRVERSIRTISRRLYRRVDWAWASSPRSRPLLSMGWTPEHGFIEEDWSGYNEAMILYILALGSPTHPIDPRAWEEWTRSYRWDGGHDSPQVTLRTDVRSPVLARLDRLQGHPGRVHALEGERLLRELRAGHPRQPRLLHRKPAGLEGLRRARVGPHGVGWTVSGSTWHERRRRLLLLLGERSGAGRLQRRRDHRTHGGGRLRRIRAGGDHPHAHVPAGALRGADLRTVRIQGRVQPLVPGAIWRRGLVRRSVLGDRPGTDPADGRELPVRLRVGSPERSPYVTAGLRRAGFTGGWLQGRAMAARMVSR